MRINLFIPLLSLFILPFSLQAQKLKAGKANWQNLDFVEDGIYKSAPLPENAKKKQLVKLKTNFEKDENFKELWNKISQKTRFNVGVDTENLIKKCINRIDKEINILKPRIKIERIGINITQKEVSGQMIGDDSKEFTESKRIFNIVEVIKNETKLTRGTIFQ